MKRFKYMSVPYLVWLCILVIIPFAFMIVLAFTESDGIDFSEAIFTFKNFSNLADSIYIKSILNSLSVALWTTALCFLLGYPVAYIVSKSNLKHKMALLMCLILPMWSNMLLRIVAWENVFYPVSILNNIGISLDLIGTQAAVVFVSVTMYLPFMIFPIFTILEKMDKSLVEASTDLGVPRIKTFLKVTFPLSFKGVVSGIIMVFLPAATGFAVSERIGGGQVIMIGNIIESMFKRAFNYNLGALLSVVLAIIIMGAIILLQKVDKDGETLL